MSSIGSASHYQVAKMSELENYSLCRELSSFQRKKTKNLPMKEGDKSYRRFREEDGRRREEPRDGCTHKLDEPEKRNG